MRTVTSTEAEGTFGALLNAAENEPIRIQRETGDLVLVAATVIRAMEAELQQRGILLPWASRNPERDGLTVQRPA
jgi:hypothetical protein